MTTTLKLTTPAAAETWMSTDLDSLANAAGEVPGGVSPVAIDADAYGQIYADIELYVDYGTNPTAGSNVELYFVQSLNGTDFESYTRGAAAVGPASGLVGVFQVEATTNPQRLIQRGILLPSLDFLPMLINKTGQTWAASGNTLKARRYTLQGV